MSAQEPNTPAITIAKYSGAELFTPTKNLPLIGYVGRRSVSWSRRLIPAAIATVATIDWAMIALSHGETINATWPVLTAVGTYIIGHRFYGRLIEYNVTHPCDDRATPAECYNDSQDLMSTDRRVLFGHHFAAIADAGLLVGPIMVAQMDCLLGTTWIVFGMVSVGAVQDYMVLAISMRRKDHPLGQTINDEMGKVGGTPAIVGILVIMTILIMVLGVVIINVLAESPWGASPITVTIPIAIFMGLYLRYICLSYVFEVSIIGVVPLTLVIIVGGWVNASSTWHDIFSWDKTTLTWAPTGYGFVASALSAWLLLTPRDYLPTFMKIGVIRLLVVGIVLVSPSIQVPAITKLAPGGTGPAFAGEPFPFLFITVVYGVLSGSHSLVSPGTTPKLVEKESQMRMIGYGGMIMESFVAVMAMCVTVIVNQHLCFVMDASVALTGGIADSAVACVSNPGLNFPDTDLAVLTAVAQSVGESSIVSHTDGTPMLAFGTSEILSDLFDDDVFGVFWYHFTIMFETLFILTTTDADTRVAHFMLVDATDNIPGLTRLHDASWTANNLITSAVVCLDWGSILVMSVTDPLGSINMLFPLFGIADQLLMTMALTLITVVVAKHDLIKWAWIPDLPLVWDLIITTTAPWQEIFYDNPTIGYQVLYNAFEDAKTQGLTEFKTAKTAEDVDAVIRNTAVQGTPSVVFAAVVLMVAFAGVVTIVRALQNNAASGKDVGTNTEPYVASRYFVPIGFVRTNVEKEIESA